MVWVRIVVVVCIFVIVIYSVRRRRGVQRLSAVLSMPEVVIEDVSM